MHDSSKRKKITLTKRLCFEVPIQMHVKECSYATQNGKSKMVKQGLLKSSIVFVKRKKKPSTKAKVFGL
jgi:hypothetical protein